MNLPVRQPATAAGTSSCPIQGGYGLEYCRSNLRATLGTVDSQGQDYKRHVHPVIKRASSGHEMKLVTDGFKWSPLKLFAGNISDVPSDRMWRLKLWLEHRDGFEPQERQEAIILITISDPRFQGKVYDFTAAALRALEIKPTELWNSPLGRPFLLKGATQLFRTLGVGR